MAKLPISKHLRDGIYVLPLTRAALDQNMMTSVVGLTSTLLDKSYLYLNASGFLANGSVGNMYVDQRRGIASFNSTVVAKDIVIDGKPSDVIVNTVGFIITSKERAFVVLLIVSSANDVQTFKELETYLNGLRFAA